MNRRTFFKKVGLGGGAVVAAPVLGPGIWKQLSVWWKYITTPVVHLTMRSVPIVAKPRKLLAKWTIEPAQDLDVMWDQETENLLVEAMIEEIQKDHPGYIIEHDFRNLRRSA